MNIPWKLKSTIFKIIDILKAPSLLYFLQKYVTKRSRIVDLSVNETWLHHHEVLQKFSTTKLIFEFGAGKNLAQNLFLSQLVDKQVVVDLNPMVDLNLVETARNSLAKKVTMKSKKKINQLNDLDHYGIKYIAPMDAAKTFFEDGSIDACISTNTLEHIPKDSICLIFKELQRVLNLNGIVSARIDYSDHYAHTDSSISLLNYLRYSEKEWKKFNHNSHYQNRLRHHDYVALFKSCGFEIVEQSLKFECSKIPEEIKKMFEGNSDDWAATSAHVVLKKTSSLNL